MSGFHKDKVEEVLDEASRLNKQMEALIALRIKVGKRDFEESNSNRHQQEQSQQFSCASDVVSVSADSCSSDNRVGVKVDDQNQDQDPSEVLEHVKINSTILSPISTIKGAIRDSIANELSFGKDDLRKAEEHLRDAFIELYHKLYLLKQYR